MADAIINLEDKQVITLTKRSVEVGVDPVETIEEGLSKGLRTIGEQYAKGEAFLPQLMVSAEIMKQAIKLLEPELLARRRVKKALGRVLIGTAEGDIHDIGKNIVGTMLEIEGFDVVDLGKDVPTSVFVKKAKELRPDILGVSALMTTTLAKQRDVARALESAGLRKRVKLIVGGAAVTRGWAKEIKADGYAEDALKAVAVCKRLLRVRG